MRGETLSCEKGLIRLSLYLKFLVGHYACEYKIFFVHIAAPRSRDILSAAPQLGHRQNLPPHHRRVGR